MSDLAVIIPTQGLSPVLAKCLESVATQNVRPSQVILVANGCRESVLNIATQATIAVTVLNLSRNEGFSRAVNKGILSSNTKFVLILNDDAILGEGCIQLLLHEAQNECYGSFAPLVMSLDGSSIQSAGLMFSNAGYGNRSNKSIFYGKVEPTDIFSVCGAAALYRRSALDDVGLFNRSFFFFFEDLELGFRLQLRGHRCLLVPDARVFHAGGVTAQRYFPIKVEQCLANSLTTAFTCMPFDWLQNDKVRMKRFYMNLLKICWSEGYYFSVLKGIVRFFARLPKAIILRYSIQKRVRCDSRYLRDLVYEGDIKVSFPSGEKDIEIK